MLGPPARLGPPTRVLWGPLATVGPRAGSRGPRLDGHVGPEVRLVNIRLGAVALPLSLLGLGEKELSMKKLGPDKRKSRSSVPNCGKCANKQ